MGIPTYRPVLLADDIVHILSVLRKEMPTTKETQLAIAKLAMYEFKIKNKIIQPQYEVQSAQDKTIAKAQKIELNLGFDMSDTITQANQDSASIAKTNKLAAFVKWKENPQSCSVDELRLVSLHRIENGLDEEFNQMDFMDQIERLNQLGN